MGMHVYVYVYAIYEDFERERVKESERERERARESERERERARESEREREKCIHVYQYIFIYMHSCICFQRAFQQDHPRPRTEGFV